MGLKAIIGLTLRGHSISPDGRYVAFASAASNLVNGDTNNYVDFFVHDMITGSTTRLSVTPDGTQGNNDSRYPYFSFNGRYITFESWASNLVVGDANDQADIFVHDMVTGSTTLASVASDGTQENNFPQQGIMSTPFPSTISDDGQFVMFHSWATNLVPDDTNDNMDIFVHDTITGQTARVSLATDGAQASRSSLNGVISADGRYVTFWSQASNLIAGYNYPYDAAYFSRNPLFPNEAPVLELIGNKTVAEGQTLTFTVAATDPDGDAITYSATNLPAGATFDPASRTFTWTPDYTQSGTYNDVTFTVTDGDLSSSESITISVTNVPLLTALHPANVWVGLKISDDAGLEFDLEAEVYKGSDLIATGATSSVKGGAGFNHATLTDILRIPAIADRDSD